MENVFFESKVMWSQIDANMHLRHSAYADFAAQARLEILGTLGFSDDTLKALKIGPILFREELIYMREVRPGDTIKVTCQLSKCRTDGSRWSFRQELYRGDGIQAALINVDGAWINVEQRKLTALPEEWALKFMNIPKIPGFIEEAAPVKTSSAPRTTPLNALESQFEDARKRVMELPEKPSNEIMLELYALNKQATAGDINIAGPAVFDFVAAAKYNAWKSKAGITAEDAMKQYIAFVKKLT